MQNITIERWDVNAEALDADLSAALGKMMIGISTGPGGLIMHLADNTSPTQIQQARTIITHHDPSVLTAEQQARIDREQKLELLRLDNAADLDTSAYASADASIRQLAEKIAWLEQEILTLRGV